MDVGRRFSTGKDNVAFCRDTGDQKMISFPILRIFFFVSNVRRVRVFVCLPIAETSRGRPSQTIGKAAKMMLFVNKRRHREWKAVVF